MSRLAYILQQSCKMNDELIIIAIEGRCCSGKTTFAGRLAEQFDCNVFHMDDFFLRPFQRTEERLAIPGGNVDYERFKEEVLIPVTRGKPFAYSPFDCHTMLLAKPVYVEPKRINIVEGTYSMHPALRAFYTNSIFLEISFEEQLRRLSLRETPESYQRFLDKWLPLEKQYFDTFKPRELCGHVFST